MSKRKKRITREGISSIHLHQRTEIKDFLHGYIFISFSSLRINSDIPTRTLSLSPSSRDNNKLMVCFVTSQHSFQPIYLIKIFKIHIRKNDLKRKSSSTIVRIMKESRYSGLYYRYISGTFLLLM